MLLKKVKWKPYFVFEIKIPPSSWNFNQLHLQIGGDWSCGCQGALPGEGSGEDEAWVEGHDVWDDSIQRNCKIILTQELKYYIEVYDCMKKELPYVYFYDDLIFA